MPHQGHAATIPTTRREAVGSTVEFLSKSLILFVASASEAGMLTYTYKGRCLVASGVRGLIPQRGCIENFFAGGARILSVDDDVEELKKCR